MQTKDIVNLVGVGWLLRRYISGKGITTKRQHRIVAKGIHKRKPITTTITLKPYPVSSIALQRYVKEGPIASVASGPYSAGSWA